MQRRPIGILFLTAIPIIFLFQGLPIRESLNHAALTVFRPLIVSTHVLVDNFSQFKNSLGYFWHAYQDYPRLEAQLSELESNLGHLQELEKENERLKELLAFKKSIPQKTVAARIIGWDASPWRKILILDKGSKHDLKKDMAVVVTEGLAGRILDAGAGNARAIVLNDPDMRVSALTGQSRAQGIVAGDGTGRLSMKYLSLDAGVSVGEVVMTSGIGGIFPKELRIGIVESVQKDTDGLHLNARIKPYVNFSRLEEVICFAS